MGRQVNFWAVPDDLEDLEAAIRRRHEIEVVHSRSPSAEPRIVDSVTFTEDQHRWLSYCLVRTEDVSQILMRHVPAQGYWVVDTLRSPVVEFDGCFFDQRILRRGRVYYTDGYYGDDAWVRKPEAFSTWAASVLALTRRRLLRHETNYLGKRAAAWLEENGGELVG
ncbi:MAG TPA: hypothetical protein VF384_19690 [Planctomycetota bacterium]